jgi:hypothetical protein
MKRQVIDLVNDYMQLARKTAESMLQQFNTSDILEAVHSSILPREGEFKSFGGGRYFVHGSSCRIETAELEIDFDFGPSGSVPGFDPWKLYTYASNHAEAYPWLPERKQFEKLIEELVLDGTLKRFGLDPSPHMLCSRTP